MAEDSQCVQQSIEVSADNGEAAHERRSTSEITIPIFMMKQVTLFL